MLIWTSRSWIWHILVWYFCAPEETSGSAVFCNVEHQKKTFAWTRRRRRAYDFCSYVGGAPAHEYESMSYAIHVACVPDASATSASRNALLRMVAVNQTRTSMGESLFGTLALALMLASYQSNTNDRYRCQDNYYGHNDRKNNTHVQVQL